VQLFLGYVTGRGRVHVTDAGRHHGNGGEIRTALVAIASHDIVGHSDSCYGGERYCDYSSPTGQAHSLSFMPPERGPDMTIHEIIIPKGLTTCTRLHGARMQRLSPILEAMR
jgi:hypothetical protein